MAVKHRLFWKLGIALAVGTLALFWLTSLLLSTAEEKMSFIDAEHQVTLEQWAAEAERLYRAGDETQLGAWLTALQARENTWAAVVESHIEPVAGSVLSPQFLEGFRLGRHIEWMIHLYFAENPIMDLTFSDGRTHFLVQLPQRMRPGGYLPELRLALKVILPVAVPLLLCLILYRHFMTPLRQLEQVTRKFTEGELHARARVLLGQRDDELTALAETFDRMAERIEGTILTQRRLIADLSHELRTPLTRIDMAVSCAEEGIDAQRLLPRIRRECQQMRALVEDTLTLTWLENEQPLLEPESFDLTDLVDSIAEDVRYEYRTHDIVCLLPDSAEICCGSQRSLSQAIENGMRNACRYSPTHSRVKLSLQREGDGYVLHIDDDGDGVEPDQLEAIFTPFFRTPEARKRQPDGHGLGLALARRQLEAVGGWVRAGNRAQGGLRLSLWIPLKAPS